MQPHKLVLDTIYEDNFALIGIHCSLEPYRLAFFINKFAKLKLRRINDVALVREKQEVQVPLFCFEDDKSSIVYYLVPNKFKIMASKEAENNLFNFQALAQTTNVLLPSQKNTDFFLKIETDGYTASLKKLLIRLNSIKYIVTAYDIDPKSVKELDQLVFN